MIRRVTWTEGAEKELEQLEKVDILRIGRALDRFARGDVDADRLYGDLAGLSKLRVGKYRVLLEIDSNGNVDVIAVGHRREVYR